MIRLGAGAAASLVLAGCASFSPDGGFDHVAALTRDRTGQPVVWQRSPADARAAQARVVELLAQPLSADSAVELALLNNAGLQARFADLGIAEADYVRAARPSGPAIGLERIAGGGVAEITRSLTFNLLDLLTLPAASQLGQQRFEQAQFRAALDAVGVAAEARRAFFGAVAAQDLVNYAVQVQQAAEGTAELARRMAAAGNFSALAQMREQAFYDDATTQLARARLQAVAERERLARVLGLWGAQLAFRLPERLPDLPAQPLVPQDAEQTAVAQRLDVQLARREALGTAKALGLTQATRYIDVLDAGYVDKRQTGNPAARGGQVGLVLPLFDFGSARVARGRAEYLQAVQHTTEVAVNARSQVRESYAAYRTAYDLARHYRDDVVPLRKRIADENQLRYNGMLISVFELLADAREQVAGVTGYIDALRDFWIADSNLRNALTGGSPAPGAGR
ncbi:MAG: TolC family protein [Burkholderiales bacterium]|nr:TolC family protein [Burkholderiales bacterium]MDE2277685.1 TolC family protein [Burkholderiales bacterium]